MSERPYTTNADLLPCPFCGHEPLLSTGASYEVSCENVMCYANPSVLSLDAAEARRRWNTRAGTSSAWERWDGQTFAEPPESAKLLAEIVQGLVARGVLTAADVASVGGNIS